MPSNSRFKKLARTLLATTCLTAGAAVANASTFLETSYPLNGNDFPTLASGSPALLGSGIDRVVGALHYPDTEDYFQIAGLVGGHVYLIDFTGTSGSFLYAYNSSNSNLGFFLPIGSSANQVAPVDGKLNLLASWEGGADYTVTLTDTTTPEPSTAALAGIAAAALLARRRKK